MSAALPSDEVAEDYKSSLEDLVSNDRNQISLLTIIAKENTEHAMAISRVLENHIRNAPPARKLPALYVLDSLAKNVGTPYTLYLGHNLYETFMNAYVLVDGSIRKKMDEMLKTWKEPVPGSLDTRPVFPLEKSRQIENALIKARTNALARQQTQTRPQNPQYPGQTQPIALPLYQTPQPQAASYQPPSIDVGALRSSLANKIREHQAFVDSNPYNQEIRGKLQTLQDLERHLATKTLGQAQLQAVHDVVSKLPPLPQTFSQPTAQPQIIPALPQSTSMPLGYNQTPPTNAPPSTTPMISNQLAEFLRQNANRQQQPTPPPQNPALPFPISAISTPPVNNVTPAPVPPAAPPAGENPLIAQLRASGLLPATGTPPSSLGALPKVNAPSGQTQSNISQQPTTIFIDVRLTSQSVRTPRPHLIRSLFEARSNRCNTCGRRFTADASGKEKKARHLDWHFKTNTRLVDAQKRGQSRSWYVDERDWIASREYEDDTGPTDEASNTATNGLSPRSAAAKNIKKEAFVKVPQDLNLRNQPCPVCQEKFDSTWSDQEQEFIWRDAIKIGQRIFHDSCYREVTKDREKGTIGGTPKIGGGGTAQGQRTSRTSTPDSVLGKRKAEEEDDTPKSRLKT
ncbi:MAG: hypothetical protein Q9227_008112 [Pyrenula ochraceoflavens]